MGQHHIAEIIAEVIMEAFTLKIFTLNRLISTNSGQDPSWSFDLLNINNFNKKQTCTTSTYGRIKSAEVLRSTVSTNIHITYLFWDRYHQLIIQIYTGFDIEGW